MKTVFLDMDGVLVDTLGMMIKITDFNPLDKWIPGDYYWEQYFPHIPDMWRSLDAKFWASCDPTEEMPQLIATLEAHFGPKNICILTKPTTNHESIVGKMQWIDLHLPRYRRQFFIGPKKEFFASSNKILIDDHDDNINNFRKAGGIGILFPRLWNSDHSLKDVALKTVEERLYELG